MGERSGIGIGMRWHAQRLELRGDVGELEPFRLEGKLLEVQG